MGKTKLADWLSVFSVVPVFTVRATLPANFQRWCQRGDAQGYARPVILLVALDIFARIGVQHRASVISVDTFQLSLPDNISESTEVGYIVKSLPAPVIKILSLGKIEKSVFWFGREFAEHLSSCKPLHYLLAGESKFTGDGRLSKQNTMQSVELVRRIFSTCLKDRILFTISFA